ncbi:MAG TPA: PilZ domain-containing protein [Elusimicrobiota bacterium]|jgi:hypothetical protein|nr:PilZ domain-containing protein [Elusimicrobiota bacterium]
MDIVDLAEQQTGIERRRQERFFQDGVRVQLISRSGQPLEPHTDLIDLSVGGLGLETGSPFKPGASFGFRIGLPAGQVGGSAQVRWMATSRRGFRCGARIERIAWLEALRLESYLFPSKANELDQSFRRLGTAACAGAGLLLLRWAGLTPAVLANVLHHLIRK